MKQAFTLLLLLFSSLAIFGQEKDTILVDSAGGYKILQAGNQFLWVRTAEDGTVQRHGLDSLIMSSVREESYNSLYFFGGIRTHLKLYTPNSGHILILGNTMQYGYVSFLICSEDGGMTWDLANVKNEKSEAVPITSYGQRIAPEGFKIFDEKRGILLDYITDRRNVDPGCFNYLLTEDGGRTWTAHCARLPLSVQSSHHVTKMEISEDGKVVVELIISREDSQKVFRLVSDNYGESIEVLELEE